MRGEKGIASRQAHQDIITIANKAGRANKGLRHTWPLLARDVLALLAGLRRAVMLDYASNLSPSSLNAAIWEMQQRITPSGKLQAVAQAFPSIVHALCTCNHVPCTSGC